MLNPPPTLRVQGPLRDSLTNVTLVAKTSHSSASASSGVSSSQTHRIPLQTPIEDHPNQEPPNKKAKREHAKRRLLESAAEAGLGASLPWHRHRKIARARGALADGLSFPGLWAGEGLGKSKQFELELQIGQPGQDPPEEEPSTPETGAQPSEFVAELDIAPPPAINEGNVAEPPTSAPDSPFPPGLTVADLEDIGGASSDFMATFEQHLNDSALADHREHDREHEVVSEQAVADASNAYAPNLDVTGAERHTPAAHTQPVPSRRPHRSLAYKHLSRATENPSPWATFVSSPLTIVSKPSIKTAKARSMTSCLTSKETFALYVRINNQTTRTKYMKLEEGHTPRMTSRTGKWSPFRFEVIQREPIANKTDADMERFRQLGSRYDDVLTYGSIVLLVDANTGIKSEQLRLTKVDKGVAVVDNDDGHPISELHRVAFVRVIPGGKVGSDLTARQYLSAPGARIGGGETLEPKEDSPKPLQLPINPVLDSSVPTNLPHSSELDLPQTLGDISSVFADSSTQVGDVETSEKAFATPDASQVPRGRKRKTPRTALAKAAVAETEDTGLTALAWHSATRGVQEIQEVVARKSVRRLATVETVEDWMCWTIVSVGTYRLRGDMPLLTTDSLSYSFFNGSASGTDVPTEALKSIPRLLVEPQYRPKHNAVDLVISPPATDSPFDLYAGTHGPLSSSLWKSSASSDMAKSGIEAPAILLDSNRNKLLARQVTSSFPGLIPHILVVVELPQVGEILRLLDARNTVASAEPTVGTAESTPANTILARQPDQPQTKSSDERDGASGAGSEQEVQATITDIMTSTGDDLGTSADPFTTAEASALADANSAWDGKLDLEIGSAFDGPETTFDPETASLMGVEVGIEKIGAALEALSGVPASFDTGESAVNSSAGLVPAPAQSVPDVAPDSRLKLERPPQQDHSAPKGLPLYLVRRVDGVGFGLAYSVTLAEVDGEKEVRIVRER